ncbi:unnamed protein product [Cochlearia groenlandica]
MEGDERKSIKGKGKATEGEQRRGKSTKGDKGKGKAMEGEQRRGGLAIKGDQGGGSLSQNISGILFRHGCGLFGCMVTVPERGNYFYCCAQHEEMAAHMDSSTAGPCIVFDGFVGVDVKLCSALLHRTVGGIPVGIPTVSENVFGLLPWQLEAGFHPQLLPGEKSRSWVFFCLNPPQGKYPTMGVSSFRWEKKSYFDIEVAYHNINLIRNSLFAGINGTKEEKAMCTSWGLLKYYHMGISLFCLTFQAKSSTIKRTPSAKKSKKEKKN